MAEPSLRERFERNASGIAATTVTGTWLAALLLDVGWWLPLMLFGYIVVVPVVALLFDADEDEAEMRTGDAADAQTADAEAEPERVPDALDRLRTRYAEVGVRASTGRSSRWFSRSFKRASTEA